MGSLAAHRGDRAEATGLFHPFSHSALFPLISRAHSLMLSHFVFHLLPSTPMFSSLNIFRCLTASLLLTWFSKPILRRFHFSQLNCQSFFSLFAHCCCYLTNPSDLILWNSFSLRLIICSLPSQCESSGLSCEVLLFCWQNTKPFTSKSAPGILGCCSPHAGVTICVWLSLGETQTGRAPTLLYAREPLTEQLPLRETTV